MVESHSALACQAYFHLLVSICFYTVICVSARNTITPAKAHLNPDISGNKVMIAGKTALAIVSDYLSVYNLQIPPTEYPVHLTGI
jgi:hypothetical protein